MSWSRSLRSMCAVAVFAGFAACSADIHDNNVTIPDAKINVETAVDVDNVTPAQSVPLMLNVQNVYLIEPSATPPPEHAADACHLQIYLDDTSKEPLLVTAQTNVVVKMPADTKPGRHKLVCRIHKHDGTPTTTSYEVSVNVKVDVNTGGTPGAGGASGTGGPPGTGGASGGGTPDAATPPAPPMDATAATDQ